MKRRLLYVLLPHVLYIYSASSITALLAWWAITVDHLQGKLAGVEPAEESALFRELKEVAERSSEHRAALYEYADTVGRLVSPRLTTAKRQLAVVRASSFT